MRTFILGAGAAMALAALAPADGLAECAGSDRVAYNNADCMDAEWTDNSGGEGSFTHENTCGYIGTMGILVDYESGSDYTAANAGVSTREDIPAGRSVANMYCCKDMEDEFCNRVDVLTADWCTSEFGESPAASTCTVTSATASTRTETCRITADCTQGAETWPSTLTADMADVQSAVACDGILFASACP